MTGFTEIRVEECGAPDPGRVIRVTFDGAPVFHYDDGRPVYQLPAIDDAGRSRPS